MSQLALFGGNPVIPTKFPNWPLFDQSEVNAVKAVAESGLWGTEHPIVADLESTFATFQGAKYALAVTNGSQTMEMILRALGIGPGDEVIVPAYTFVATATAALMVGATPIVVDVRADTLALDPDAFRAAITPRTRAVMPVHIAGVIGPIDEIIEIAREHQIVVVEDCAHAHGAQSRGRGSGSLGTAGSFSFQGGKVVTSGEGGMIVTSDKELYEKCWKLREGGYQGQQLGTEYPGFGSNYRMSAFQAAIIQQQLQRFTEQIPQRLQNIQILDEGLKQIPGITPQYRHPEDVAPGYLYLFYYDAEAFNGLSRYLFINALQAEGVPCGLSGYPPLYRTHLFRDRAFEAGGQSITHDLTGHPLPDYASLYLPNVERISREVVCIPHVTMLGNLKQVEGIVEAIGKIQQQSHQLPRFANTAVWGMATLNQKLRSKMKLKRSSQTQS